MSLHGKVAIVTGSTKGIGFAISKEFAENKGAIVGVCSRSKQRANYAAKRIRGKTIPAKLDVTDLSSIKTFLQQILSSHKRVDILINNAGYPFDREIWYKKFHEVTDDDVQKIIEVD